MSNPLSLTLFVVGICLFAVFYVVSKTFYYSRHKEKYHFYQMFPYEFNYPRVFKENLYGNILMILACLAIMVFYEVNPLHSIYSIVGIILSIITTMMIVVLLLFPIRYLRTHMIISSLLMVISMALPMFNLFAALQQMKIAEDDLHRVLAIVSMVISGLLAVSMLLLIMNPKLTFKIYMDKVIDEQGNEVLKRPKVILMALNEWWAIFIYFLAPLALLLLLII